MEGQQTIESLLAIGSAILIGVIVLAFIFLFEKRMRKHNQENVTNILRNPHKLELRKLRQEIEAFKQRQTNKINGNHVEWK